jgi:hypothetical protein
MHPRKPIDQSSLGREPTDTGMEALQAELSRESLEGRELLGDMGANRTLSGSSTWETLPTPHGDEARDGVRVHRSPLERTRGGSDSGREQQARVADQIATRLRANGVSLFRTESLGDLADLLEAVERFEEAVEQRGGDLMVDEPINGIRPIAPDVAAYLLPTRRDHETVASFLVRIDSAVHSVRELRRKA